MGDLSVSPVGSIDVYSIRHVFASSTLTEAQKLNFLMTYKNDIQAVMKQVLSSDEYDMIMLNRPLLFMKPIKNALTKRGDKLLMAKALGLPEEEIDLYIRKNFKIRNKTGNFDFMPADKAKILKSYIYRHGSQKELLACFDYELLKSDNLTNTIKNTMSYNTMGVADYFSRPIHRMTNKTFVNMFNIINKHIENAKCSGQLTEAQAVELSMWALQKLYVIQNNSRLFKKKINNTIA